MIVYWSCLEDEWMRALEPEPVAKRIFQSKKPSHDNFLNNTSQCPAIGSALNNMYALSSIYSYDFELNNDSIITKTFDQKFFDEHIVVRDIKQKFFSMKQNYIFFTPEKSLEMTAYIMPFAEENDVVNRTFSLPGTFDIGKWFRPLEFNFYLKNNYDHFSIKEGDAYTYIQFDTKRKIKFKQFVMNDQLYKYLDHTLASSRYSKSGIRTLADYYNMMLFKNKIIDQIKENLCQ